MARWKIIGMLGLASLSPNTCPPSGVRCTRSTTHRAIALHERFQILFESACQPCQRTKHGMQVAPTVFFFFLVLPLPLSISAAFCCSRMEVSWMSIRHLACAQSGDGRDAAPHLLLVLQAEIKKVEDGAGRVCEVGQLLSRLCAA